MEKRGHSPRDPHERVWFGGRGKRAHFLLEREGGGGERTGKAAEVLTLKVSLQGTLAPTKAE